VTGVRRKVQLPPSSSASLKTGPSKRWEEKGAREGERRGTKTSCVRTVYFHFSENQTGTCTQLRAREQKYPQFCLRTTDKTEAASLLTAEAPSEERFRGRVEQWELYTHTWWKQESTTNGNQPAVRLFGLRINISKSRLVLGFEHASQSTFELDPRKLVNGFHYSSAQLRTLF